VAGYAHADLVGEQLGSAFVPGVTVVIADMTATARCDSWGVRMLVLAHRRAAANHAELRLVAPSAVLRHTFTLMGLWLPIYPSMSIAAVTGTATESRRESPSSG
jgi:anti-anti-sigma regulatory factor